MHDAIGAALKAAMLRQDKRRTSTLRLITAAIKDRDIAARSTGKDRVSEEEILEILNRMIRQRQESAKAYEEGSRLDLAEEEREEIAIIRSFLPPQLDDAQLHSVCAETVKQTVGALVERGERVGVVQVRLYRPFPTAALLEALPATVRTVGVLDRTKEPGSIGEPLYLDVVAALAEACADGAREVMPRVSGGRYGLSSKEFTPAMVKAVLDELDAAQPRRRFTVGITDDVTHLSLPVDDDFDIEPAEVTRAVFFGLGADGTVSSNKAAIRIIGDTTPLWCQGHFVYDSKKAGAITVSHLRFGPKELKACLLYTSPSPRDP